jgi:hypothetical protein
MSVIGDGIRVSEKSSPTERAAGAKDPFATLSQAQRAPRGDADPHPGRTGHHRHRGQPRLRRRPPAGRNRGVCLRLRAQLRPRKRGPEDRLKAGLHPTCYRRWLRWRSAYAEHNPRLSDFIDKCYVERGETRARPVAPPAGQRAS